MGAAGFSSEGLRVKTLTDDRVYGIYIKLRLMVRRPRLRVWDLRGALLGGMKFRDLRSCVVAAFSR